MLRVRLLLPALLGAFLAPGFLLAAPAPKTPAPVRVLLLSSAATREFQFLRYLLQNEQDQKRGELRICLLEEAPGAVANLAGLQKFPSRLRPRDDKPENRDEALSSFDVVIAFDPEWEKLNAEQRKLLNAWVMEGGGLIAVAGPIHTLHLARLGLRPEMKPITELFPVELSDVRLHPRDAVKASRLNFGKVRKEMTFLKLDPQGKEPLAGWDEFFGGSREEKEKPLARGFYSVYPVKKVKPGAIVLATFADRTARLDSGEEAPYLAAWAVGKGQVFYISSGEMWRLRQYKEAFHQRFWTELIPFVRLGAAVVKP